MADTIIDNINSIIRTKSELKSVLTENGQNPSDTFSEYPDMFRSVIESAGADEETINSYISAYLSTYNFIDQDTLSANSYITLQDIPSVDLSSYVTYDFLNAQSYLTSIPNTYPTYTAIQNMTYITMADVSACGYITANDVDMSGYLPTTGGTLSGNLVPSQSASYNLGSSSSRWKEVRTKSAYADNTYSTYIYSGDLILSDSYNSIDNASNTRINFKINQNNRFKMTNVEFAPVSNSGVNLGTNSEHFKNTYSYNYYTGFNTALTSNSDYNLQFNINGAVRFGMDTANFFPNGNGNKNLGTTANQWAYTYTNYLILNGTDIMNIIGDVETLLANI